MRLNQALKNIGTSAPASEKIASAAPASLPSAPAHDALRNRLQATLSEKTASDASAAPVPELRKMAEELAAAEKQASVAEAQLMGTAFGAAAVAQLAPWVKAAHQVLANPPLAVAPQYVPQYAPAIAVEKTAGEKLAEAAYAEDFDKFASELPDLMKEAYDFGYAAADAGVRRYAQDSFDAGFRDGRMALQKTAALEFIKVAMVADEMLRNQG